MRAVSHSAPSLVEQIFNVWRLLAAAVLITAGFAKLHRPASTVRTLAAARLPASRISAVILGLTEVLVGAWNLMFPSALAVLFMGVLYLGFSAFVSVLLIRGQGIHCGCFGAVDAPVTWTHLTVDAATALAMTSSVLFGDAEVAQLHVSAITVVPLLIVIGSTLFLLSTYLSTAATRGTAVRKLRVGASDQDRADRAAGSSHRTIPLIDRRLVGRRT